MRRKAEGESPVPRKVEKQRIPDDLAVSPPTGFRGITPTRMCDLHVKYIPLIVPAKPSSASANDRA